MSGEKVDQIAADVAEIKRRLEEVEKKIDIHANTYHTKAVDTLTAWRKKGGYARAQKKTAAERSAEMREVVRARWARRKQEEKQQ